MVKCRCFLISVILVALALCLPLGSARQLTMTQISEANRQFEGRNRDGDCDSKQRNKQGKLNEAEGPSKSTKDGKSFSVSTASTSAAISNQGSTVISATSTEAISISGTLERGAIATGSFSASTSASAAVSNNSSFLATALSAQASGTFKINLNNFSGKFLFSYSQTYARVTEDSVIIQDCNTYKLSYTRTKNQIKFGQIQVPTNLNCSFDVSIQLINKVVQLLIVVKKADGLEFQNDKSKLFLKTIQRQPTSEDDIRGLYSIEYPSYSAQLKANKIYFEDCKQYPVEYTCNEEGGIKLNNYPNQISNTCLRDKQTLLQSLKHSSRVRSKAGSILFQNGQDHNLLTCKRQ